MLYTVYRTVNLANGKYYFGVHKTEDPNDGYLGSGRYIRAAVAKHGEAAFRKKVLFTYLDPESAFAKEDELIQCCRSRDLLCMNLRRGGSGGFDWINKNLAIDYRERGHAGGVKKLLRAGIDPQFRKKWEEQQEQGRHKGRKLWMASNKYLLLMPQLHILGAKAWKGKHHTVESKKAISASHMGTKNAMWGTCWMYNDSLRLSKRFLKAQVQSALKQGWEIGRRIKFCAVVAELADASA